MFILQKCELGAVKQMLMNVTQVEGVAVSLLTHVEFFSTGFVL